MSESSLSVVHEIDTECAVCHHHTHEDRKADTTGDWKPIEEFACPQCGQHTLKATSLVKESNVKRHEYTSRKKGKIKENAYTVEEAFTRFWVLRESYVKKTGEGLGAALTGLDFSDILGQKNSKGKKNGEFLEETFFEMEYDGYRIAICGEKDSKPEFVVYRGTIDNCFL